jgi:restriction system protein
MNSDSQQRVSELLRGVIELLWHRPDGLPAREVMNNLPDIVKLTGHEIEIIPAINLPRYEWTIRMAIMPLVKAGWVAKTDKGQWRLTEEGRSACRRFPSSQKLFSEALRLSEDAREKTSEILVSLDVVREKAWETIADFIRGKTIMEIRQLMAFLLEAMQYHAIWVAPPQKDHGMIDVVANIDPLGAKANRILVQVKHTGQPVTLEGLKSFSSILGSNDFGLFFSTGGFTAESREAINKGSYQKINAMDLEKFFHVWLGHYEQLSREAHILLPLKAIFFLSPPE